MTSVIDELRSYRIPIGDMNITVFDLSGSLIGGYLFGKLIGVNPYLTAGLSIPVGIVVHEMVGVETQISKKMKERNVI